MSKHQKRLSVPKSWPVARKEGTFTTKADAGPHGEAGVPLIIVLRDVLGYVDSKKEARFALGQDSVLVNGKPVSDEGRPIGMFDILAFTERDEYYRVFPGEGGRLALTPVDEDSAGSKLGKVAGKAQVSGGDTQLTLHDGQTLLVDDDYRTNDSLVVSNDDNEVVAHFPYEEGALVTAVAGTHAGEIGTVDEIQVTPGSSSNNVLVSQDDGEGFETVEDYVVVIDENFTADDSTGGDAAPEDVTTEDEPEADAEEAEPEAGESEAEAQTTSEAEETEPEAEAEETEPEVDADEADEADEADADAEESEAEEEAESDADEDEADADEGAADADEADADTDDADDAQEPEADEAEADDADDGGDDE